MEKYFLYVRKSSEGEDRQVQSIPDQISVMEKKAKELGITIGKIFTEEMSAKAPGRPIFNEMIEQIKEGEASRIITWKLDRLSRNPIDSGNIQYMLQTGELAEIVTSDKNYNETDAGLLFSVESGIGNQFILDLKKNIKRGLDYKIGQGVFCARVPEGYLNKKDDNTIIVDPEKFNIMREMWNLMLSGDYTTMQVLNIMNNDWGFKTRKTKRKGGDRLSRSGIYRILNNIFYTGDFIWKGKIYKGTHQPMITYEEFYRVQELLGEKGIHTQCKTREFAFTGFIKCGECGSAITAEQRTKKIKTTGETKTYVYYHCTKRKEGCENCSQKPITLDELEKQINNILNNIEIIPEFTSFVLKALKDDLHNCIETKMKIQKSLQASIDDIERKLKKLTDVLIAELIGDEEYKISKKQLKIEIEIYREKLNKLNLEKDESFDGTERVFKFITEARMNFNHGTLQTKKEIFRALGLNWVLKDGILHYEAFPWFKKIEDFNKENLPLEPNRKGVNTARIYAQNTKKNLWSNLAHSVRISILEYGEKVYLPTF